MLWQVWWVWIVAGFALGVLEVIAPGYIFLGFAIGAVAMFALQPNNEPPALTSTAIASTATPVGSAAL